MSTITPKKKTNNFPSFGAPDESFDAPSASQNVPSSSMSSRRILPTSKIPTLATLCARVFATNFVKLRNSAAWDHKICTDLRALPDPMIPRIFAILRTSCPTFLKHEFILTYLLRGPSITLSVDLLGVNRTTVASISRINPDIHELELSGFDKIADNVFASLLQHLTNLDTLILRGCTKVGALAVRAAAKSCPNLKIVNLNHTSVTPASLAPLITACTQLEVLKLAGIQNWTDAKFANLVSAINKDVRLSALVTLKIRQTSLSDSSVGFLLALCPGLQRLDVSFTLVRHPVSLLLALSSPPPLQKLSLTSTAISASDLIEIVSMLPQLRVINIGALGGNRGSKAYIGNSSAMTIDDNALRNLTDILARSTCLENINLVGNTKLGVSSKVDRALSDFVHRVGRKCKSLNFAGIPGLRSLDLAGLLHEGHDGSAPNIETLILNNTGIDDEAGVYISTCTLLSTLGVAGTKMTEMGLFPIIDACPRLESLDLTSCRGINVGNRRRFFEVWEDQKR